MVVSGDKVRRMLLHGGGHVVAAACGLKVGGRHGMLVALGLMGCVSFYAWATLLRQRRAVADTPTARIASAAQGYVEFEGRAERHEGAPLLSALRQRECCWFRYAVEEKDGDGKWRQVDAGESAATFLVRDASGACSVDPEGADVSCRHHERWSDGDARYEEWRIQHGDPLYVLGEFSTRSLAPDGVSLRRDVGELLAEWKRDRTGLLHRFDRDGNGEIDPAEWEFVREAALREVEQAHAPLRAMPGLDLVRRPADGRPFLLSHRAAGVLAQRLGWSAWVHVAVVVGAVAGAVALLHR